MHDCLISGIETHTYNPPEKEFRSTEGKIRVIWLEFQETSPTERFAWWSCHEHFYKYIYMHYFCESMNKNRKLITYRFSREIMEALVKTYQHLELTHTHR